MANKKLVFEFEIYTDGKLHIDDITWLTSHKSRFFEQEFYEYTIDEIHDGGKLKFRRIFSCDTLNDISVIESFINRFSALFSGSRTHYVESVQELFASAKEDIKAKALNKDKYEFWDFIDSNVEADLCVYSTKKELFEIEEIKFKDIPF